MNTHRGTVTAKFGRHKGFLPKIFFSLFLTLVVGIYTSQHAMATPQGTPGGTLTVALDSDFIGFDPHGASAGIDRSVYTSIYNTLVTVDRDLNIVPELAESWDTPDETTYIFHLRQGVKFHDGTDFNAQAVKSNFDWILDEANASPRRPELSSISEVTVVDDNTVKVSLNEPFAPLLAILTDRAGYIVSPVAREKYGDDLTRNPVGTGPFEFVEHVRDDHSTFKRFEGYWESGLPLLDQIVYRPVPDSTAALTSLRTGAVDFLYAVDPKDVPTIETTSGISYLEGPSVGYQGLWINTSAGPLANKSLREAVTHAIDRETLLNIAYRDVGQIASGPVPPSSWAFDPELSVTTYDPELARQKLAEGGQPNGFDMVLKVANAPLGQLVTQLIQAQLAEVGIRVQVQSLEFGALLQAGEDNDFDALSLGWSGRIDPDGNIEPIFHTNGAFNYGRYSNPKIDKLIADGRQTSDRAERIHIYQQISDIINEDVAYMFTYFEPSAFAKVDSVKGFEVTPDGLMRFKTTYLER